VFCLDLVQLLSSKFSSGITLPVISSCAHPHRDVEKFVSLCNKLRLRTVFIFPYPI
jgi:hypothetical protein